jgi:hypothetical protein
LLTRVLTSFASASMVASVILPAGSITQTARGAAISTGMTDGMEFSYERLEKVLSEVA